MRSHTLEGDPPYSFYPGYSAQYLNYWCDRIWYLQGSSCLLFQNQGLVLLFLLSSLYAALLKVLPQKRKRKKMRDNSWRMRMTSQSWSMTNEFSSLSLPAPTLRKKEPRATNFFPNWSKCQDCGRTNSNLLVLTDLSLPEEEQWNEAERDRESDF